MNKDAQIENIIFLCKIIKYSENFLVKQRIKLSSHSGISNRARRDRSEWSTCLRTAGNDN